MTIYWWSWAASLMSIAGALLNIMKNKWGFVVWTAANMIFFVTSGMRGDHGQMLLWVAFTVMNIIGFLHWKRKEEQDALRNTGDQR